MKRTAEGQVEAGDEAGARETYGRLLKLALSLPSPDAETQQAVLDAIAASDRLARPVTRPDAIAVPTGNVAGTAGDPADPKPNLFADSATRPSGPPGPATPLTSDVAGTSTHPATSPVAGRTPPATEPIGEPTIVLRPLGRGEDDLDARVELAIRKGAEWLLRTKIDLVGESALAVYSLVAAGQAVDDKRLAAHGPVLEMLLDKLKRANLETTYGRAVRASALAVHARPEDMAALRADVYWLVGGSGGMGNYTYGPRAAPTAGRSIGDGRPAATAGGIAGRGAGLAGIGDNSNSQYGLLGVWAGAEAGVEVTTEYWAEVERHWQAVQLPDGAWPYQQPKNGTPGRFTMTCAGIVSTAITHDYLHAAEFVNRFAAVERPAEMSKGISWLDESANGGGLAAANEGYARFGLERVGLATGMKYIGNRDWYRDLAERLIAEQNGDGSWGGRRFMKWNPAVETSFNVLFLARGRHPVMMNKLRYDGRWFNRPRDVANVTRSVSHSVERPLAWQVVNFDRPGTDWLDAPILYISGNQAVPLFTREYLKLRDYVRNGGLVFLHADGGSPEFAEWARKDFVPKVWPGAQMAPLPPTHGLFRTAAKLAPKTRLEGAGNGARLFAILSPDDVAGAWQGRDDKHRKAAFDVMLNTFVYATENIARRNRLQTPVVPNPPADAPLATFGVARVRHAGDWDPEPGAWPRFAKLFRWQTNADAEVTAVTAEELARGVAASTRPAVPGSPAPYRPVLAHLTGTAPFPLSQVEADGLRAYVEAGGVLLVEACGGSGSFATFADETLVPTAFPGIEMSDATPDQVPLAKTQAVTDDLTKRRVRPYTAAQPAGRLVGIRKGRWGKGWVLVSRYDLTEGLLGTDVWGVIGFSPDYCVGVVKNVLVWAATMRGGN